MRRHAPRNGSRPRRGIDRLTILVAVLFGFALVLILRLFTLQVLAHGFYTTLAAGQHEIEQKLLPERGQIYITDRFSGDSLFTLATNREMSLVYAVPTRIAKPDEAAKALAPVIGLEETDLLVRLSKPNDLYEPLKHQVDDATKEAIQNLKITGIEFSPESVRYYPEKTLASHVLGFVGFQGDIRVGQYGLEGFFNSELAGKPGFIRAERDAAGRWITVGRKLLEEAQDGDNIVLTIDRTVEFTVCTELASAVQKHGADSGAAIVMDPSNGAIIAMCSYPDFDPNTYNTVEKLDSFVNTAVSVPYEPGSVFKSITMAAAIDQEKVTPTTTYIDSGSVEIGPYTIRNSDGKANGEKTMTQVLEMSLNTGAIFAAEQIGPATFAEYVKRFGFGEATGIQLSNESAGTLSELESGKEIYMATGSFGQGITVTPLQLVAAYSAIANGGTLYQPYIVDRIVKPNSFTVKTEPRVIRQVISERAATTIGAMLVNVVKNGHGQKAGVPGYYIAGKTGTAQTPRTDGVGYDPNRTIGTFAGYGPVDDPKFVIVTKLVDPKDVQFAESTAAPLFGRIAQFLVNYFEIPPTVTETGG